MDDLKFSHVESSEVTRMIEWLESRYRKMPISRGKVHYYLVIDLYYLSQRELSMIMVKYAAKIIKEFPEYITASAVMSAENHLFDVSETVLRLRGAVGRAFNIDTVRLLLLYKSSMSDIQTEVVFLTKRDK